MENEHEWNQSGNEDPKDATFEFISPLLFLT